MLLRWRTFFLVAIASFAAKPGRSEEHVHSRQKRGGLLNLDVRLDLFGSNRRQHTTTPQPEGRILPLPPGTEAEDHGAPIKDEAAIQRFISQLESYRKRNSGLDSIPILGGVVKKVRRFQACATPKLEKGHCRHVQHCVLPAFLRNINILLSYACFIGGAHLGVCCPDRHFDESIVVDDDDEEPPTTTKRPGLLDGLVNPLKDIISPNRPDRPDKPSRPDVPEVPDGPSELEPEPSYEDDKRPVVVSPPPVTYPPTKSTTTTTTTQAPETPQQADGSQITKYSSTCGLSIKSRIVGGEVANKELWSWIAALMKLDKRTNQMEQFCGGVVISNRYIVTAAHCLPGIHPRDLTIRLGEFDFTQKDNNRRQDFRVSRIVRHPHFNETNNNFADIALVKVNRDIAFNRDLLPVCMPEEESYADKQATVVGWGVTSFGGPSSNILMQLSLPVWANSECQEKLNTVVIHPEFLCAGLKDRGGHDSCQGDSGGPLMVENSNMQWSLVGIVSWGFKCAQKGIPAVYTRVTEYRDWIYRNAA